MLNFAYTWNCSGQPDFVGRRFGGLGPANQVKTLTGAAEYGHTAKGKSG
jgi:hypothetical protein